MKYDNNMKQGLTVYKSEELYRKKKENWSVEVKRENNEE